MSKIWKNIPLGILLEVPKILQPADYELGLTHSLVINFKKPFNFIFVATAWLWDLLRVSTTLFNVKAQRATLHCDKFLEIDKYNNWNKCFYPQITLRFHNIFDLPYLQNFKGSAPGCCHIFAIAIRAAHQFKKLGNLQPLAAISPAHVRPE